MKYCLLLFPGFRDKAVTLSYDDATINDIQLANIMIKYGLKGTFNVNSQKILDENNKNVLSENDAKKLYSNNNFEVAVHGEKHLSLSELDIAMMTNEVINDRKLLEKMFSKVINGMAYANGSFDDIVVDVLKKCGIKYSRTTKSTEDFNLPDDWLRLNPTCHHNNPRLMELAKKFIEEPQPEYFWGRRPRLFYLWGHSYEFKDYNNWNIIEEFASYIGNREDVWYATNIEIYNYVQAFKNLQFSAEGIFVFNPSSLDVYLNYYGNKILVPSGKIVPLN